MVKNGALGLILLQKIRLQVSAQKNDVDAEKGALEPGMRKEMSETMDKLC